MAKRRSAAEQRVRRIHEIYSVLRKQHEVPERPSEPLPLLETILLAILAEDADELQARQVLERLSKEFVDWNELRVSPVQEIAEYLDGLPAAAEKARLVKRALHHIFESVYRFDIEDWAKKGIAYIEKMCGEQEWFTPHVRARIVRDRLRRRALPVDATILRVWRRIGLPGVNGDNDRAMRQALQQAVPVEECYGFEQASRLHGLTVCLSEEPRCDDCWLQQTCEYAASRREELVAVAAVEQRSSSSGKRARGATKRRSSSQAKSSGRKKNTRTTGKRSRKKS